MAEAENEQVLVLKGDNMAAYGFGAGHPFGPDRHAAFHTKLAGLDIAERVRLCGADPAGRAELETFHTPQYVDFVEQQCRLGQGFLDAGDTPAQTGLFEAATAVVGGTLTALEQLIDGRTRRAFVPIGGLHHAGREHAAGFCVFNDCGIAAEVLRQRHGVRKIAYVDIDAHHGDGMFYAFEDDPDLYFADIHEDGRALYPGTGHDGETGTGLAAGTKLNIPMPPLAGDEEFFVAWERIEAYLNAAEPEFILFQCGADSLAGDPITHLQYSESAHGRAAASLCRIADVFCDGRLLAMGGGGYDRGNLARAWTAVVAAMVESTGD